MEYVQRGLLALAILWSFQVVGSIYQIRKYQKTLGATLSKYKKGYLGVGNQRSYLSAGSIVILVLSDDLTILAFQAMIGRTVLSKFQVLPEFLGYSESKFIELINSSSDYPSSFKKATAVALDQARRAHDRANSNPACDSIDENFSRLNINSKSCTAQ